MVSDGASKDIWVYDPQRDAMSRLTFGPGISSYPAWSPDGKYVAFTSYGKGIFQARADGARQPQPLIESKATLVSCAFKPDGNRLAYNDHSANSQIWRAS
jgi:Tol biopolymer transport system component